MPVAASSSSITIHPDVVSHPHFRACPVLIDFVARGCPLPASEPVFEAFRRFLGDRERDRDLDAFKLAAVQNLFKMYCQRYHGE